jgi:hypothetical protein
MMRAFVFIICICADSYKIIDPKTKLEQERERYIGESKTETQRESYVVQSVLRRESQNR